MSLNSDLLVSRDVLGFVQRFLDKNQIQLPSLLREVNQTSPDKYLNYTQWREVIENIASYIGTDHVGIEIGKTIRAQDCGVLGYLFQSSPTLLHALSSYQRYHALLYSGVSFHVTARSPATTTIAWHFHQPFSNLIFDELVTTGVLAIMQDAARGKSIQPKAVFFRHAVNEEDRTYYQKVFCCEIYGNSDQLEIVFASSDIDLPISTADMGLNAILEAQAQALTERVPASDSFIVKLRDSVVQSIHDGSPNVDYVAKLMGTSSRTLHRKLEARKLKFRNILRDVRRNLAENYLSQDALTIVEIAFLLGYSEQSTFTRAFSSWNGTTPAQFRKNQSARPSTIHFF